MASVLPIGRNETPPSQPVGMYRRLDEADRRHIRAHLLRLHPDDLRHRFMGARQRSFIDRYVGALDWDQVIVVGYFANRSLRGVCELHPIGDSRAEIAISVERRFQRRGIGAELFRRMLILARNRGITVLELRCMATNERIRRLIRRFNGEITFDAPDACGTIRPLPPTAATLVTEMVEQAGTFGNSLIHLWLNNAGKSWPSWAPSELFAQSWRKAG